MAYKLGDVYIGKFPIGQSFGVKPDVYNARFNLKGHNGQDFMCPSMTPILSAADGWVSELGFDPGAYGKFIKIVHDGYLSLYAHLNDYTIKQNEKVIAGQLIGHSNNTGLSDTPHLHFGVAPCDLAGTKTQKDNGYGGYIDPMGNSCQWEIVGLQEPVTLSDMETKISIPSIEYTTGNAAKASLTVITTYLINNGLNDYLIAQGKPPIDLNTNPSDSEVGEKIVQFLTDNHVEPETVKSVVAPVENVFIDQPLTQKKTSVLKWLWIKFRDFTFTQP